jgi:hypothetical protein
LATNRVDWYLVVDKYQFHVYVVAAMKDCQLYVRIDWHNNSTLCFEPYIESSEEKHLHIGRTRKFCRQCILDIVKDEMQSYKLFKFNCRTLSYMVLTKAMQFDAEAVYEQFNSQDLLCGLDMAECLSLEEMHHYYLYANGTKEWCVIL